MKEYCRKNPASKVYPSNAKSENQKNIHSKVSERSEKAGHRPLEEPHNGVSKRSKESRHCQPKLYSIDKVSNASLDKLETTSELRHNVVKGNGDKSTTENKEERLKKRAKIKFLNDHIAKCLASRRSELQEAYNDTVYCSSLIIREGDKQSTKFCRRRWCINCNRMRAAELRKRYESTIESWEEKCFLTLTVKNPTAENLSQTIKTMHKYFTEIKDSERKAGRKLIGIRKLEITYNRKDDTYHPHFHFILKDDTSAEHIILKWLRKYNSHLELSTIQNIKTILDQKIEDGSSKRTYIEVNDNLEIARKSMLADPQFQDYKKADNDSAMYLFKYFTKLTSNSSKDKTIIIKALDIIFRAVHGKRTFQPFGFIAHKENVAPEKKEQNIQDDHEYRYFWDEGISDWIEWMTGERLSMFEPTKTDFEKLKTVR